MNDINTILMQRRILVLLPLGFLVLVLGGCYLGSYFPLEVLKPARYHFSAQIQSLSVAARLDMNKSYKEKRIRETSVERFKQDSLLTNELMVGLIDFLGESPRFELISPMVERSLVGRTSAPSSPLPWKSVDSLCEANSSDALLSLASMVFSNPEDAESVFISGYENKIFCLTTYWRLYQLNVREISQFSFVDSLVTYFALSDDGISASFYELSYIAGVNSAKRFAPYWVEIERYCFPIGPGFEDGMELMKQGKAVEAIEFWKDFADHRTRSIAATACYNLAVSYEMANDPGKALISLDKSKELGVPAMYVNRYIRELKDRMKELEKVMKQMNDL